MKLKPVHLLVELGIPQGAIQRLLSDPEAILMLGDFSISLLENEVLCFDHATPLREPLLAADHLDYFKRAIAICVEAGNQWILLEEEAQQVAVMSFETEDSDAILA